MSHWLVNAKLKLYNAHSGLERDLKEIIGPTVKEAIGFMLVFSSRRDAEEFSDGRFEIIECHDRENKNGIAGCGTGSVRERDSG